MLILQVRKLRQREARQFTQGPNGIQNWADQNPCLQPLHCTPSSAQVHLRKQMLLDAHVVRTRGDELLCHFCSGPCLEPCGSVFGKAWRTEPPLVSISGSLGNHFLCRFPAHSSPSPASIVSHPKLHTLLQIYWIYAFILPSPSPP